MKEFYLLTMGMLLFIIGVIFFIPNNHICISTQVQKITAVGGCDKNGQCGVITEYGYKNYAYYPVVGQTINQCVKYDTRYGIFQREKLW